MVVRRWGRWGGFGCGLLGVLSGCNLFSGLSNRGDNRASGCGNHEFLQYVEGTCGTLGGGVCTTIPDACPEVFAPVCGCDNLTYNNECEAQRASESIRYEGACLAVPNNGGVPDNDNGNDNSGDNGNDNVVGNDNDMFADGNINANASDDGTCGGIAGLACGEGEFCQFATGNCGDGDQTGNCTAVPDSCNDIFSPVCGCNGVNYANECEAWRAAVSVDHEGDCL